MTENNTITTNNSKLERKATYKRLKKSVASGDRNALAKIRQAIDAGFNINYCKKNNMPLIFLAAQHHRNDIVEELLNLGASVNCNVSSISGQPNLLACMLSAKKKEDDDNDENFILKILERIAPKIDFNMPCQYGINILEKAISKRRNRVFNVLLSKYGDKFSSQSKTLALWKACSFSNASAIERLLSESDIDLNYRDDSGKTLLHVATKARNTAIIDLLLSNGIDINLADNSGNTPIHIAAMRGDEEMFNYLYAHGGDVYTTDISHATLLDKAVEGQNLNIINRLLSEGLDPNVGSDEKRKTAIFYRMRRNAP